MHASRCRTSSQRTYKYFEPPWPNSVQYYNDEVRSQRGAAQIPYNSIGSIIPRVLSCFDLVKTILTIQIYIFTPPCIPPVAPIPVFLRNYCNFIVDNRRMLYCISIPPLPYVGIIYDNSLPYVCIYSTSICFSPVVMCTVCWSVVSKFQFRIPQIVIISNSELTALLEKMTITERRL